MKTARTHPPALLRGHRFLLDKLSAELSTSPGLFQIPMVLPSCLSLRLLFVCLAEARVYCSSSWAGVERQDSQAYGRDDTRVQAKQLIITLVTIDWVRLDKRF